MSTDHRPSVDQLLTDTSVKYRPTIGEGSAKCRLSIGERKSYIGRDTSGTTIDRVSTECRPTIVRVSTDYRSTIDRLSTAISTDRSVDTTYIKHDPVCLAWVVFSDYFITKSCYQTKILAGLVICVLATSLLVSRQRIIFFSHTLILHCRVVLVYKIKT